MDNTDPYARFRASGETVPFRYRFPQGESQPITVGANNGPGGASSWVAILNIPTIGWIARVDLIVQPGGVPPTGSPLVVDVRVSPTLAEISASEPSYASIFTDQSQMPTLAPGQFVSRTDITGNGDVSSFNAVLPVVVAVGSENPGQNINV